MKAGCHPVAIHVAQVVESVVLGPWLPQFSENIPKPSHHVHVYELFMNVNYLLLC